MMNSNHHLPNNPGFSDQTYNENGNGDVWTLSLSSSDLELLNQFLVDPVDSPAANNTAFTSQEIDPLAFWRGTKELGLTLTVNKELLSLVDRSPPEVISSSSAFHLNALSLRIGSWEIKSTSGSDIKCKGFPKKSSFAWELEELIDGKLRLKKKIEFEWSNIKDMKVNIPLKGPGYLAFKLKSIPSFYIENSSSTRKHTDWKKIDYDFTDNQASLLRMHILEFKPGLLEKHYHKFMKAHPDPDYYCCSFSLQDTSERLRDIDNYLRCDNTHLQTPDEDYTNNDYNQNDAMRHLISVPDVPGVIDDGLRRLPSSVNEASSSAVKRSWETDYLLEDIVRGTKRR